MTGNDLPGRLLTWLTGLLFVAAFLLVGIGQREESAWLEQLGWLACSLFLFMPLILLLIRPSLTMAVMHALFGRNRHYQAKDWQQLTAEEKAYLILAALLAAAAGVYVLTLGR